MPAPVAAFGESATEIEMSVELIVCWGVPEIKQLEPLAVIDNPMGRVGDAEQAVSGMMPPVIVMA